jgi:LysM domain-containing protein
MTTTTDRKEPAATGRRHRFVLAPARIRLTFLREADRSPLANVAVRLELPDGSTRDLASDANGIVEVDGLRPGTCRASSPLKDARLATTSPFASLEDAPLPAAASSSALGGDRLVVARIEEHKVKKGESIDSLAKANGLTWQELSKFNWGTSVPDEINEHLRDEVGCTKRTADGYNYMFDESDDPGIVFIPTVWRAEGLATGRDHVVLVRAPSSPFVLRFVLESETTGHLLPFHPFTVREPGGAEIARGKTNADAEGIVGVPRRGEYEVVPGVAGTHSVQGRVTYSDAETPIANASLKATPWQEAERSVHTGRDGGLSLEGVPVGELVLEHQGAQFRIWVREGISDATFFLPLAAPPGPPSQHQVGDDEGGMERYITRPPEPHYDVPDFGDGTAAV